MSIRYCRAPALAVASLALCAALPGAITINWKEGKAQTFSAGSTYFEGLGANHRAGSFAARNTGNAPTSVVIIELVPQE